MKDERLDLIRRAAEVQDAYHYALLLARDPRDTSRESSFDGRGCSEYSGFRGNQKAIKLAYDILFKHDMGVIPALPALNSKAGLVLAAERILASIRRDEERNGYDAYTGTVTETAQALAQQQAEKNRAARIKRAEEIITEAGAALWASQRDPELLGCSAEEHEEWLATAPENEIRSWAKDVARDEEKRNSGTGPQSCYPEEIATLREMLDAECERADHIDEQIDKYGAAPDLVQRRNECAKRVDALSTAIEALGGAL